MKMRPFQIVLFAIFGAFAVGGLIMFAAFRGFDRTEDPITNGVLVWGTLPGVAVQEAITSIATKDQRWARVQYVAQDPRTFSEDLVESIAEGRGPDLILLPNDLLARQQSKLSLLPYTNMPLRDYRDTFIEGAEIFLDQNGFYGFPIVVDPLVMYWNRTMVTSAQLATPPRTWEEMVRDTVPSITKRLDNNDIQTAALAFGEYTNVVNAKPVVLMLMVQAGSRLVERVNQIFSTRLNEGRGGEALAPGDAALRFYTQFSNPATITYSWNRGMRSDRDAFLAEDLALYFGFGSEYSYLRAGNSNLNFDIAEVPQGADTNNRKNYGIIYALTIPKTSKNPLGAYEVAATLSGREAGDLLARALGLAPARRDLIQARSGTPVGDVLYRAALIAQGWLDPNPGVSDTVFKDMIESITSGRAKSSESIEYASYQLQKAF
jgi:ABC-type glycerol-3-phosphate transport system substrate-binding protein